MKNENTKYKILNTDRKSGFTPHINCDKADPISPYRENSFGFIGKLKNTIYNHKSTGNRNRSYIAGFTLIEILITMSILATLSGILIGYSAESSRQTSMIIARERVIRLFARVRSLSTATYSVNADNSGQSKICAYGLHVDRISGKIFIFQDMAMDCSDTDYQYRQGTDVELTGALDYYSPDLSRVQFVTDPNGDLDDVVFVPPNPNIFINGDKSGGTITKAGIDLQLKDGSGYTAEVNISNAGQVGWK